uniref:LPS-assembly lipoprotein LptE n=1 Tax=Candidatus Aschnera chinzeii TaxID=1485666 RepID=A0AAT9G4H2_9ENTR|nr:MAG: hypothetical protein ACHINZ_2930 [Candidatus Aschnera chinzeii]
MLLHKLLKTIYKILYIIVIIIIFSILEHCSLHTYWDRKTNNVLKLLSLDTKEYFHPLIYNIKKEFYLHKINIINNKHNNIVILKIYDINEKINTISVFNNGNNTEKEYTITLVADIIFPNGKKYKINLQTSRNIFVNIKSYLYTYNEQSYIQQEIYDELAIKLIEKIFFIYNNQ